MAEVAKVNGEGLNEGDIVGSADIEALYPSLDIDFTIEKVCEVFEESAVTIEGIDYEELSLYISLNRTDDEIQEMGLGEVCPKRRTNRGPRPIMTGCGATEKKEDRYQPWVFPDTSDISEETKRRLVVEAMRIVLKTLMETHTYEFAGEIRRQKEGGAIGMELTGVVAQVFLVWWDRQLRRKLAEVNFNLKLHKRYIDDTNVAGPETPIGARYDGQQLVVTEESIMEDRELAKDRRTMTLFQSIANSIHPSIRVTIDYPSKHPTGKVPMLDVQMWMEVINRITVLVYEHYEKEMATKSVIHANSAIPTSNKRTILTQEVLRIILHCSNYLPWETVTKHINHLMMKMQYSGYDKIFRYQVVKSAINAYVKIREKEELGIRPIHRPKEWKKEERRKEKEQKRKDWYKGGGLDSVVFIPTTPSSQLKKMYEREIRHSGLRIKVVERTGRTLKSQLQTSNPFRPRDCGRNGCFVCTTTNSGNCNTEGVTYNIKCVNPTCTRGNSYRGESANNGYTRGDKHLKDYEREDERCSPLWRHCLEEHGGRRQDFTMEITGTFRNDTMMRQITEAVQINNENPRTLMNTRAEWRMARVPRTIIAER